MVRYGCGGWRCEIKGSTSSSRPDATLAFRDEVEELCVGLFDRWRETRSRIAVRDGGGGAEDGQREE